MHVQEVDERRQPNKWKNHWVNLSQGAINKKNLFSLKYNERIESLSRYKYIIEMDPNDMK